MAATKKSAAKKPAAKTSAAKKKQSTTKKGSAKKSTAKKRGTAKKSTTKKGSAKKSTATKRGTAKKSTTKKGSAKAQVPFVDYLVLGDRPYLRANECKGCGARYFDRRNACASCFGTEFKRARVKNRGEITSFSIVAMGPQPYVSAIVDCDGTSVRCTLVNVEADPEHVHLGMKVKLATYSMGTDAEGTEAIAFGFEPG